MTMTKNPLLFNNREETDVTESWFYQIWSSHIRHWHYWSVLPFPSLPHLTTNNTLPWTQNRRTGFEDSDIGSVATPVQVDLVYVMLSLGIIKMLRGIVLDMDKLNDLFFWLEKKIKRTTHWLKIQIEEGNRGERDKWYEVEKLSGTGNER